MNKFAKKLTELMRGKNITQTQLAEHLNVGQQSVSRYMSGKREPSLDILVRIAKFFEVTVNYLLGLED